MDIVRKYSGWFVAGAFLLGLFIGLVVLGWWLWPVQWTDATPAELSQDYQNIYVQMTAELYAQTGNQELVNQALGGWGGDVAACNIANSTDDPTERARMEAVAIVVNGAGCAGISATPVEQESGGGSNILIPVVALLFLLAVVVGAIFFFLNRRNQTEIDESAPQEPSYDPTPAAVAASVSDPVGEVSTIPIARFHTTYTRGNDAYDDSFSIENANAEFLGECGVGIAESIGADATKNATALEIWLFDKSDIRTITKVLMSDHAFFDDALKAKLAPKGEPVLARATETIVLETASLIINAEITEMEYGSSPELPNQSYFQRLTVSLSAWAKEGTNSIGSQHVDSEIDDLMDF